MFAIVYDVQRYSCQVVSLHRTREMAVRAKGELPDKQKGRWVHYEVFEADLLSSGYPKPGERAACFPVEKRCWNTMRE